MFPISTTIRFAPYAVIGALAIAALWYRAEAVSAESKRELATVELQAVKTANDAQAKTIARLTAQRIADDETLAQLSGAITELQSTANETQLAITDLERNSDETKAYMALPIPDDLKRLLNKAPVRR